MAQKEVIRWGVIGCGDVVETKNGPGLYLADGSELVGIWNRTKQKAVDWCERHGHGRAFDSLNELLNCPDIDIVYVATTPNCHKEHAIAVAEAGKDCYLEKPIALSWDEAQEIKSAFERAGKRCFVVMECHVIASLSRCLMRARSALFAAFKLFVLSAKPPKRCFPRRKSLGVFALRFPGAAISSRVMRICSTLLRFLREPSLIST